MGEGIRTPSELESETRRMVSISLSKLEIALSEWDAAKQKPRDLEGEVAALRHFHGMLSGWEKESLKGAPGTKAALLRLRRFSEICRKMELSGVLA